MTKFDWKRAATWLAGGLALAGGAWWWLRRQREAGDDRPQVGGLVAVPNVGQGGEFFTAMRGGHDGLMLETWTVEHGQLKIDGRLPVEKRFLDALPAGPGAALLLKPFPEGNGFTFVHIDLAQGGRRSLGEGVEPATSPDGQRVVLLTQVVDSPMARGVAVHDLTDGSVRKLAANEEDWFLGRPVWSPDNRRIAFIISPSDTSDNYGLAVVDLDTPADAPLTLHALDGNLAGGERLGLCWLDADHVAWAMTTTQIAEDADGRPTVRKTTAVQVSPVDGGPAQPFKLPAPLPEPLDTNELSSYGELYGLAGDGSRFTRYDLRTGQTQQAVNDKKPVDPDYCRAARAGVIIANGKPGHDNTATWDLLPWTALEAEKHDETPAAEPAASPRPDASRTNLP